MRSLAAALLLACVPFGAALGAPAAIFYDLAAHAGSGAPITLDARACNAAGICSPWSLPLVADVTEPTVTLTSDPLDPAVAYVEIRVNGAAVADCHRALPCIVGTPAIPFGLRVVINVSIIVQ
jgi:hypothetical protein